MFLILKMSSAFYPQGMKSYNNHVPQGGYKSWKGSGMQSNPLGVAPGHIRPLTNNDPGNIFPTGFGLPRPIKHYRRGRSIQHGESIEQTNVKSNAEADQINYNIHRYVKSSKGQSLGGGGGGTGMIQTMMDVPGGFLIKNNESTFNKQSDSLNIDCKTCEGVGIVSSWYPINNLTETPEPVTTVPTFCCNEEYKARRRVLPASTNVKKNYYQNNGMYLYNRCQTFVQREFNFVTTNHGDANLGTNKYAKPGSAESIGNLYVANCNPNITVGYTAEYATIVDFAKYIFDSTEYIVFIHAPVDTVADFVVYLQANLSIGRYLSAVAYMDSILFNPYTNPTKIGIPSAYKRNGSQGCGRVYYKPNNPTFAKEGAVSSATRTFKLNVDTIETNAASLKGKNKTDSLVLDNPPNTCYVYKMKTPKCNPSTFTSQFQNPRMCNVNTNDISA